MTSVSVSSKYQVVIPQEIRKQLGIRPGQKVTWVVRGKSAVLVPVPSLHELRGIAPNVDTSNYRDEGERD